MTNKFFKIFYKIHIYVGLFVALHLFILTLTGAVLLFKDEIAGEVAQDPHTELATVPHVQNFFAEIIKKYPGERPLALSLEESSPRIAQLRLGKDGAKEFRGSRRVYFDTVTGAEVSAPKAAGTFMDLMLRLHREFLLGSNGKIYVGVIGLLYAFVLLSGFFIYGNFAKKTSFGEIRRQSPRSLAGDLHRYVGITIFGWGLLIAVTGLFLGLSTTLIKVYQYSELKKLNSQYAVAPTLAIASLDKVLATAQGALPEASFDYLAFPDTQFSPPGHFLVLMHGNTTFTERLVELVVVDAATGELTEVRALPWYLKFTMLSEPLHFGNYGGIYLKILWLVLALVSLALPGLGLYIWYARRNKSAHHIHKQNSIKIWVSQFFKPAYLAPSLLFLLTGVALIGSFFTTGVLNQIFVTMMLVPLYFVLRVLLKWMWERRS